MWSFANECSGVLQPNKVALFINSDIPSGYNAGARKQPTATNTGKFYMVGARIQPNSPEGAGFFPTDVYYPSPN